MWGKITEYVGIALNVFKKQQQKENQIPIQRIEGYIDFKISNNFNNYVTVNDTRLYYDQDATIKDLQEQFYKFHKKELILENNEVKIQPEMKVSDLIKNQEDKQIVQKIFVELESQQTVIQPVMIEEEKLIITKIAKIQKQQLVQKCQVKQKKQKNKKKKDNAPSLEKKNQQPLKQAEKQKQKLLFQQYVCEVQMHFGPRKPKKFKFEIKQTTTFNQIINELKKQQTVKGDNIQFSTKQGQIFDPSMYDFPIHSQINHQLKVIIGMFSSKNSFLKGYTKILIGSEQNTEVISLNQLHLRSSMQGANQNQQISKIINYDTRDKRFQVNTLTNFRVKTFTQFVRLQLQGVFQKQKEKVEQYLQATAQTRVLFETQQADLIWMPIGLLKKDDQICGIMNYEPISIKYKVIKTETIQLENPQTFYSFSAKPYRNFIGNNIIIHNCNPFSITVYWIITQNQTIQHIVEFHRGDKLTKYFGDKICIAGGIRLNNQLTFGDYQLQNLPFVHIYENYSCIGRKGQQTLTEWKKRETISKSSNQDNWAKQIKNKLQNNYFGIYNKRLIGPRQIQEEYNRADDRQIDIIIGNRTVFQRFNYYINKQPRYTEQESKAINEYSDVKKLQKFIRIVENSKKLSNQQRPSLEEMLGMYLYSSNIQYRYRVKQQLIALQIKKEQVQKYRFYYRLNEYLRQKYVLEDDDEDEQFLPVAGWILKSLNKTKKFSGIVYRGVKNIILQKALGLKNGQEISQDKFIVFNSFTSTSTDPTVAKNFNSKNGENNVVFTLNVRNGRSILNYSDYQSQKEILIPPFTYFFIKSFNINQSPQAAQLQQIPMPQTNSPMILFWVDDEPWRNRNTIEQKFVPLGIEVVQIVSTKIMKIILHNFLWIFRMMGKKVVILSDMVRTENKIQNYEAGIDLFRHISQYGFSNKAIIFAGDLERARQNLANRGIDSVDWRVISSVIQLTKQVKQAFQINEIQPIL